ncbi:MAG: hypothetical protein IJX99_05885 [Clostridia bacterium]|nr:hypothetical protein [Clostridia bacterium]
MYIEVGDYKSDVVTKIRDEKNVSISKLIHVRSIDNYKVKLVNNKMLHVLKIEPINFNLKSQAEQKIILESYKMFLKQCNFNFQIYVQTQKTNAEKHISEIKKCIEYEPKIAEMAEDYIDLIKEISEIRGSISRKFFIVIEAKEDDYRIVIITEGLKACGNHVSKCGKEEIMKMFRGCFKSDYQNGVVLGN